MTGRAVPIGCACHGMEASLGNKGARNHPTVSTMCPYVQWLTAETMNSFPLLAPLFLDHDTSGKHPDETNKINGI